MPKLSFYSHIDEPFYLGKWKLWLCWMFLENFNQKCVTFLRFSVFKIWFVNFCGMNIHNFDVSLQRWFILSDFMSPSECCAHVTTWMMLCFRFAVDTSDESVQCITTLIWAGICMERLVWIQHNHYWNVGLATPLVLINSFSIATKIEHFGFQSSESQVWSSIFEMNSVLSSELASQCHLLDIHSSFERNLQVNLPMNGSTSRWFQYNLRICASNKNAKWVHIQDFDEIHFTFPHT